ncbi:MAG TPA: amino acid adenylation domain-containing protein [Pyrinomonadaceae bacterium]|nr:amino acid adenylation domain-containing protein [Pyrinomonadaceae bacterium]
MNARDLQELVEDIYELSALQQGMLFHSLSAPESAVYFEQLSCTIDGELQVAAFRQAWDSAAKHHPVLRSALYWEGLDKPYQVVYREVELPWTLLDWREVSEDEQRRRLADYLRADRHRDFDLTKPPLMRFALIRLTETSHQFVWSFHHLLLDGWSIAALNQEVLSHYQAIRNNRPVKLETVRPYRDYILWLQQQDSAASERFWRRTLQGFTAQTPLAFDHLLGNLPGHEEDYDHELLRLPAPTTSALQTLARKHQLTFNTTIQAMWALLLSRYSGERDIVWGTTVSGRPATLPGAESMIGLFINTLPLRAQLDPAQSLVDWMKELQQKQLDLRQFEHSSLVEVHGWSDVPRSSPLFESLLVFENYPIDETVNVGDSGLRIRNVHSFEKTNYPLSLLVAPDGELILKLFYDRRRFETATIKRMLAHCRTLLERFVENPEQQLAQISLLNEAQQQQILVDWNQTAAPYPANECIYQLFEQHAQRTPEKTAVVCGTAQLTYRELNQRANQLARHLRELGVKPDGLVGICAERSLEMVVAILGVMKAGGAYVPLDPAYPQDRLAFMLEDAQVGVLLTQQNLLKNLPAHNATVVCLDCDWEVIAQASGADLEPNATPANLAYVIYTSGSTGRPKGVMVEHHGLANLGEAQLLAFGLLPGNRVLQFASLSFDASIFEMVMAWKTGATICLASGDALVSGDALGQLISEQAITNVVLTPSVLSTVPPAEFPSLKTVTVAGEACPGELVVRWAHGRRFFNLYGPTETTVWATFAECNEDTQRPPIGRPIANAQVYILDDQLQPVSVGVAGELHVGGAGLARGYLNRAELTALRFIPNPFVTGSSSRLYKTGDLVRYASDGNIEFLGRIDQQVKLRGFRIELGEIEAVLAEHDSVQEVVIDAREDEPGQKRLVAYVVGKAGATVSTSELRELLKQKLPQHMIPAAIVVLDKLPLTPNSKLDRKALPAPEMLNEEVGAAFVAPASEVETAIAAVWSEVLKLDRVGRHDNFFDLGGHSLLIAKVHGKLVTATGTKLSFVDLFKYPTVSSLAAYISGDTKVVPASSELATTTAVASERYEPIAIIGMAGKFPGAKNIDQLWQNLRAGVESIRSFSDDELRAAGISEDELANPAYVKAGSVLEDADLFDAQFFGFNPREAEVTDPQHRLFLECAHQALESSGYNPAAFAGLIGVFAGATPSTYLYHNIYSNQHLVSSVGAYQIGMSNDKDFVPTRVSYKLNLRGPSVNVQSACSTSLVAVHLACQSLLRGECQIALAGGVTVNFPQPAGYWYQEEGIRSPDGHCRTFDAQAQGTVGGSGVGVVVLKKLAAALRDGDHIRAVIRGSAINNDGANKIGFTAPGIDGQSSVIAAAQAVAGVSPDSISYVEAHGTGTLLGDPIEVAALTQAFRLDTKRNSYCGLGSVKSNFGHLDAAAGVTGLIKTVLQLEHHELVPSLHYREPNPELQLDSSPFYVNAGLKEWQVAAGEVRRAGVSSFGIGGTNSHVIVEEAPAANQSGESRATQLLLLAAKSPESLDAATAELTQYLNEQGGDVNLADVAYTLAIGREGHEYRRVAIASDATEAANVLENKTPQRFFNGSAVNLERPVTFMFPGQAAQYPQMGRGLYETEPIYRQVVDECAELLQPYLGLDLKTVLYPAGESDVQAEQQLKQTGLTQPGLFVTEYALARLLMSWGLTPSAMIGHSIGEYVVACLAGVFSLPDALKIVAERGRLMQALPAGAMLAVPLSEERIRPLLNEQLSLAAVNAPSLCAVSGPAAAIDELERELNGQGLECRRLRTSHAFHSSMMDPMLEPFTAFMSSIKLSPPTLPCLSNVSGTWITPAEATDPNYWTRHLRQPVRFSAGLEEVLKNPDRLLLEVGPGQTLSTLAKIQAPKGSAHGIVTAMRHAQETHSDQTFLLQALSRLWVAGAQINWSDFYAGQRRQRLPLPTYAFARQRYWIEPGRQRDEKPLRSVAVRQTKIEDWFYTPSWKRSALPPRTQEQARKLWLVFQDETGIGAQLSQSLRAQDQEVVTITPGERFARLGDAEYMVAAGNPEHYQALLDQVCADDKSLHRVVHLWSLNGFTNFNSAQETGFFSLLNLAKATSKLKAAGDLRIDVITSGIQEVSGAEVLQPEKATVLGACKVIGQEFANLTCRNIDVEVSLRSSQQLTEQLLREVTANTHEAAVAYRGAHRWLRLYEPVQLAPDVKGKLRRHGVYLITGGLGNIGFALAEHLAGGVQAKLVLVSRKALPPQEQWDAWLSEHSEEDVTSRKLVRLRALAALGAQVMCEAADVGDEGQMREVIARAEECFGPLNGVIHAAGVLSEEAFKPISRMNGAESEWHFQAKAHGTLVLEKILTGRQLDFCLLFSSLSTVLGGLGYAAYSAANSFLDAFACQQTKQSAVPWTSINWDGWQFNGNGASETGTPNSFALTPSEGIEAFNRIISADAVPQVIVSTADLQARLSLWEKQKDTPEQNGHQRPSTQALYPRPALQNEYVEARNDVDRAIINIWRESLGVEQVGIHDNFFDLGGHSLLATQVIAELNKTFPVGFSIADLFERSTVFALSNMVLEEKDQAPSFAASSNRGQMRRERQLRKVALREEGSEL